MLNYFGHRYIEIILVIDILKFFWYLGLMGVCFVFVVDLDIVVYFVVVVVIVVVIVTVVIEVN